MNAKQREDLIQVLTARFEGNTKRHTGLDWNKVRARLDASPSGLLTLSAMEGTGGEPDVIGHDRKTGEFIFCDCAPESPAGRRSLCYDGEAQRARKAHAPSNNAVDLAADIGIDLLTEEEYRELQTLGAFDTRTSSWIRTPPDVRKLGGALFADRRYGRVFVYHNGAQSYYQARGFRGVVRI